MTRAPIILAILLVTGCQGGAPGNEIAATNVAEVAQPTPAPAPRPRSVQAPDCPPPPSLALSDSFGEYARLFSTDSSPYRQTRTAFEAAYRKACASGILREKPLMTPGAARPDNLLLKNAPDANIASIYRDGDGGGPMVLEYPFVTGHGEVRIPGEEELGEAIYCSVHGSSEKEQEESGRCLPD
jgi:hypothetical protein